VSTAVGRRAEAAAAEYLMRNRFTVLQRNWRTRWCEVDIVASRPGTVYFVEVKYRGRTDWGSGLDYITRHKVRQMYFAAHFWAAQHNTPADYCLLAIELTDDPPRVTRIVRVA
jgi:uncharacterized protein (TIGR00252 family)